MIDIDHIKNINDTYGHLKGDHILRELACTLKRESREYDIPVRYGGEAFALILPNTKMEESILIAERTAEKCGNGRLWQSVCDNQYRDYHD